ncbi:fungal-specific transcription factor domain-containing protein [Microdochium trichocladiopsis]|uniref:Fungal-specific transcription factor domain-containing protein n=1 Tax=Microdochium trichocladiopsis TaxID=1682393 RepID=A0A9P8XU45_9PEZI|nr:fungal-specific transcription factor domain-containing protein [Microdochium trichocladiopsis]KAH7018395.1 fungal-specific transcription factor domain-containing protein [Microdochium trichocladiopsis]
MTDPIRPLRPAQSASPASPNNQPPGPIITTTGTGLLRKRPTCSQCRIRKVRCDGQQHICGNCQRLRFECSFQQNSNPSRSEYVLKVPEARRRMQACIPCHDKKTRCLGELPSCTNCMRKGRNCVYPSTKKGPASARSRDVAEQPSALAKDSRSPSARLAPDTAPASLNQNDTSPGQDVITLLVENYFRELYPLPSFSFLHKPTVIQRCEDGTINEQLKLAICAITALQLQLSAYPHDVWAQKAEHTILQQIGQPSIFQLQSLFLIVRYRIESGGFPKAFMLAGLAARIAVALRLNYERRDLSYVAQEARRRLYWSLYLLDDYFCVGLREFELCPEETIHLQLPCTEEVFEAGGHTLTGPLQPDPSRVGEPTGLHASYLRVTSARRANMRFIRRLGLGEESPATLRTSIATLEQNLSLIHAGMGELGTYSVSTLTATKWPAEYLMLHVSWHQCHCDLYRSFIDSYSEAAPVAVLEGLHPQDRAAVQRKCVEHAEAIIDILSDFAQHGHSQCQLERDIAVCAFEAARIVMFDCRRTGQVGKMHEALVKASLCFQLITRHFSFSASTQPLS